MTVKRVTIGNAQDDATWLVLEASVDGVPAVTHRRTIHLAALAAGHLKLADEKAALIKHVEGLHANYLALQEALKEL